MLSIINELEKFGKRLEQHCVIKNNIDPIILKLKLAEDNTNPNDNRCLALVETQGTNPYQCTRIRKDGYFCGLHTNKKNNFKRVENSVILKEVRTFKYNLTSCDNNSNKNTITTSYLFDFIDSETFRIDYMNNIYRINKNNKKVWFEDTNSLVYMGHIDELNIPIKIY